RDKLVTGVQTCALPIWTAVVVRTLAIPDDRHALLVRVLVTLHLARRPAERVHRVVVVATRHHDDLTRHRFVADGAERSAIVARAVPVATVVHVPELPVAEEVVIE